MISFGGTPIRCRFLQDRPAGGWQAGHPEREQPGLPRPVLLASDCTEAGVVIGDVGLQDPVTFGPTNFNFGAGGDLNIGSYYLVVFEWAKRVGNYSLLVALSDSSAGVEDERTGVHCRLELIDRPSRFRWSRRTELAPLSTDHYPTRSVEEAAGSRTPVAPAVLDVPIPVAPCCLQHILEQAPSRRFGDRREARRIGGPGRWDAMSGEVSSGGRRHTSCRRLDARLTASVFG